MAFTWCRGVVDCHVHFVDPGALEREDFLTGSSAAAVELLYRLRPRR